MPKNKKEINIKGTIVTLFSEKENDFICLTDMAKSKNPEFPADVIKNWLKTRFMIDFVGLWEQMYNPNFNLVEFDQFKNQAGVNSFVLSPDKWIKSTDKTKRKCDFADEIISRKSKFEKTEIIKLNQTLILVEL